MHITALDCQGLALSGVGLQFTTDSFTFTKTCGRINVPVMFHCDHGCCSCCCIGCLHVPSHLCRGFRSNEEWWKSQRHWITTTCAVGSWVTVLVLLLSDSSKLCKHKTSCQRDQLTTRWCRFQVWEQVDNWPNLPWNFAVLNCQWQTCNCQALG